MDHIIYALLETTLFAARENLGATPVYPQFATPEKNQDRNARQIFYQLSYPTSDSLVGKKISSKSEERKFESGLGTNFGRSQKSGSRKAALRNQM